MGHDPDKLREITSLNPPSPSYNDYWYGLSTMETVANLVYEDSKYADCLLIRTRIFVLTHTQHQHPHFHPHIHPHPYPQPYTLSPTLAALYPQPYTLSHTLFLFAQPGPHLHLGIT